MKYWMTWTRTCIRLNAALMCAAWLAAQTAPVFRAGVALVAAAVVVQFELGLSRLPLNLAFYYDDGTASQMAGARLSLRRSLPRLN